MMSPLKFFALDFISTMEEKTMQKVAFMLLVATSMICGCASVRQADLDAWVGQSVVALETHPIFLTVPVVKTQASDGTEIWNYVNGANLGQCSGGGSIYSGTVDYATYSKFSSCVQRFTACNNIFFIRDGRVTKYTPIGTGGARCYTTEQLQPGFSGATNIR
jgi:hypothetical protein